MKIKKKIYIPECLTMNSFHTRVEDEKKLIENRKIILKIYKQMSFYRRENENKKDI